MAFALVTDVDQHELAVDPQHPPLQHRVDGEHGRRHRIFLIAGPCHGEFEFLFEIISEFKFTNKVAVDHALGGSGKNRG